MCADGAPSRLGTQLGLISRPPDSTCSRAYVEGGTHKFKADGVVFYNKEMLPGKKRHFIFSASENMSMQSKPLCEISVTLILPVFTGYSALFRHPNDELNYCVYIIPGNPKVTPDNLKHWHDYLQTSDPNISRALGEDAKIERMNAGEYKKHWKGTVKRTDAEFHDH